MARVTTAPGNQLPAVTHWGEFADGRWWELKQGEDYDRPVKAVISAARQWAFVNGFSCSAYQNDDKTAFSIRFLEKE